MLLVGIETSKELGGAFLEIVKHSSVDANYGVFE